LQTGSSSDADVQTFDAKNIEFFAIYGMFARTRGRGVEPVPTFCGKGGKVSFRDFVWTFFMDGPLSRY